MEKVNAFMFIVPNYPVTIDATNESHIRDLMAPHNYKITTMGLPESWELRDGDVAVQVWVGDVDVDNWNDHGMPKVFGLGQESVHPTENFWMFPNRLPLRVLKFLQEGDTLGVEVGPKRIKVNLEIDQLGKRYASFGRFEEVLQKITIAS